MILLIFKTLKQLRTYIVWNKRDRYHTPNHITHISPNLQNALEKSHIEDETDIFAVEDGLIDQFSSISCEDLLLCSSIDLSDEIQELYFLKIHESGPGGGYMSLNRKTMRSIWSKTILIMNIIVMMNVKNVQTIDVEKS